LPQLRLASQDPCRLDTEQRSWKGEKIDLKIDLNCESAFEDLWIMGGIMIKNRSLHRKPATLLAAGLLVALAMPAARAEQKVEVLHFWTTGGEAAALDVVKKKVTAAGVTWQDAPIAGGGGDQAKTALQARIASGNPPAAMLMLGYNIIDWAKAGMLADLKDIAAAGDWDNALPEPVKQFTKIDGRWVSAPTNVHRVNMVWASKAAFDKIGAKPPASWEEFNAGHHTV
jgi:glucose/mannose transport system substrate-binding protein